MEQPSGNKNIISTENETNEFFLNDIPMEKLSKNYLGLEIKSNKILNNEEEEWKWAFRSYMSKKLNVDFMAQMHFVRLCLCIHNNKKIDRNNAQMKHCILYYNNFVNAYNPIIEARKGLILYYKNDMIIFSNHVNVNHTIIAIFWEEEVNNPKQYSKATNKTKA